MLSWIDIVWRGCYYLVVGKIGQGRGKTMDMDKFDCGLLLENIDDIATIKQDLVNVIRSVIQNSDNMSYDEFCDALYARLSLLRDVTDNSIKSPRLDCAGDRWAWSHRYERWVVTDVNTDNETNAEKRFDPAYPGVTFVLKLDTVTALNNWCGPLKFAVDDV